MLWQSARQVLPRPDVSQKRVHSALAARQHARSTAPVWAATRLGELSQAAAIATSKSMKTMVILIS
jgi:hypothetical protein